MERWSNGISFQGDSVHEGCFSPPIQRTNFREVEKLWWEDWLYATSAVKGAKEKTSPCFDLLQ